MLPRVDRLYFVFSVCLPVFPPSLYLICKPVLTSFTLFLLNFLSPSPSSPVPSAYFSLALVCALKAVSLRDTLWLPLLTAQNAANNRKDKNPSAYAHPVTLHRVLCFLILMQLISPLFPSSTLGFYSFFLGQVLTVLCPLSPSWSRMLVQCTSMFVLYVFAWLHMDGCNGCGGWMDRWMDRNAYPWLYRCESGYVLWSGDIIRQKNSRFST